MSGFPRIVIVGDGLVGWLAAAMLGERLRGDITLVPTEVTDHGLGPFGDAIVALPEWQAKPIARALPQDWLLRNAAQSHALGMAFTGWASGGAAWFLPFGDCGAPVGHADFRHLATRARLEGHAVRLADYSLAALAAQAERFAFPDEDPRSPRSTLAFAAHLDADGLSRGLRALAIRAGVRVAEAPLRTALTAGSGIEALMLVDGSRQEGDLFIDATGSSALLAGEALGVRWQSWKRWLPCDAALSRRVDDDVAPPPYSLSSAHDRGWMRTVPLRGGRVVTDIFAAGADALPEGAVRFESGVRERPWVANCVAVGAAAMLVEPLLGTPLLTATTAIERLMNLLPSRPDCHAEAAEYNRLMLSEAERLRDAVLALWKTNGRVGEPLWDGVRNRDVPEALSRKLASYVSRGYIPLEDEELFEAQVWVSILDGQGVHPRRHDPQASAIPMEQLLGHFAKVRQRLIDEVRAMPSHMASLG